MSSNPGQGRPPAGRVLVLGRDDRSLLACVRSLGRRGHEVHLAWCPADALARRSRFVTRIHDDLPAPTCADGDWFEPLSRRMEEVGFNLVFPTSDPAVVALTTRKSALQTLAALALPSPRAYEVTYDKQATWELARAIGLPVPPQDVGDVDTKLAWPRVVKPRHAWRFGTKKWEQRAIYARDPAELAAAEAVLSAHGQVLVQGYVPGCGVGIDVLARAGEVLLAFQHERLHELPAGGSTYRRSAPLDPLLLEQTRELVRALDLTGLAMVEFRRDRASGRHWLLEVNARPWGSMPLAVAAGADFPAAAYDLFVHDAPPRSTDYCTHRFNRQLARDPWFVLANRHRSPSDPTGPRLPAGRLAGELGPLLRGRERWDELTLDDPRPGLVQLGRLGRDLVGLALGRATNAGEALLAAARARRARRHLARARSLLFVCKGNICRSPFAAAVARQLCPGDVEVHSSGTYRDPGRPCPVEARLAAAKFGIDLSAHRSVLVDESAMDHADVVFTFDRVGARTLVHHFPEAALKLVLVGDLDPHGPRELPDPYGGGYPAFHGSYVRTERLLRGALAPSGLTCSETTP